MMGISGIGAKKLESYGAAFLAVITGSPPQPLHPARRRLAGSDAARIFDRLAEVQVELARSGDGRYLSCTHTTLRQIAERRPSTLAELATITGMGEQKIERFGAAFLAVLDEVD